MYKPVRWNPLTLIVIAFVVMALILLFSCNAKAQTRKDTVIHNAGIDLEAGKSLFNSSIAYRLASCGVVAVGEIIIYQNRLNTGFGAEDARNIRSVTYVGFFLLNIAGIVSNIKAWQKVGRAGERLKLVSVGTQKGGIGIAYKF